MDYFESLNNQQKEAVQSTARYVRVIAGAGSGKTRVLVLRLVHLIHEIGMVPHRLCAITFTNKAAREMKERLNKYLGDDGSGVWISTIHSLCVRILREDITSLKYPRNFTICDRDDQTAILRQAYKTHDLDLKAYSYASMLAYISNNKGAEITVERAYELAGSVESEKLKAKIYDFYETRLKQLYALDFDDLLLFTARLFRKVPEVLKKWQERFDTICVDEFQDVDHIQYEIITKLASKDNELYVVGDPDQTIYTWRGADVNIILDFEKRFKEVHTVVLNENYRSTTPILEGANALIKNNKYRVDKKLFTSRQSDDKIIHMTLSEGESEAIWVASQIKDLISEGYNYGDIAILYRSNYLSRNLEKQLSFNQIPHIIYSGISFYARKEVKEGLSYLRMALQADDLSFMKTISAPRRGIGEKSLDRIADVAQAQEKSMFETIKSNPDLLSGRQKASLMDYIHIIEILGEKVDEVTLEELMISMLEISGLQKDYEERNEQERVENLKELINDISSFSKNYPDRGLEDYLETVALSTDASEENNDTVKLMTIHAAKGLEFKVVFVISFAEGVFPNERALNEGKRGLEEERRLAYVAMTRAMDKLYLTDHRGYSFVAGGSLRTSRFVDEVDQDFIEHKQMSNYGQVIDLPEQNVINDKIKGVESRSKRFKKNEWIVHTTYGEGLILKVDGDIGQVAFNKPFGIKQLQLSHPAITKRKKKERLYDA